MLCIYLIFFSKIFCSSGSNLLFPDNESCFSPDDVGNGSDLFPPDGDSGSLPSPDTDSSDSSDLSPPDVSDIL